MKCKLFVIPALVTTVLTFGILSSSAQAEDEQERGPASQRHAAQDSNVTPNTPRATEAPPVEEPYRRDLPRDVVIPKFQYTAMLGVGLNSSDELNNDSYQHQVARSPVVLGGFHYTFFRKKHFNMLVGADLIFIRSTDVASSSRATATYKSDNWDGGPTLGIAWIPGQPNSKFQLQAKFGTGLNFSHTATLQSPGFTSGIDSDSATSSVLAFWADISAVFAPTPNWRILGTLLAVSKTDALLAGVAYAY